MATLNVHSHYLLATWHLLQNDFGLMTTASQVGGGLLGAGLFALLAPLLSSLGATILAWFGVIAGILVFLGVGANQVFNWLQAFGQACKRGLIQVSDHITALKKQMLKRLPLVQHRRQKLQRMLLTRNQNHHRSEPMTSRLRGQLRLNRCRKVKRLPQRNQQVPHL